jgi:hypothetical protein
MSTIPATGPISYSDFNQAKSVPSNTTRNLSDMYGFALAVPTTGSISMSDLRGKKAGLAWYLNARNTSSYPSSGSTTWFDLGPSGVHLTMPSTGHVKNTNFMTITEFLTGVTSVLNNSVFGIQNNEFTLEILCRPSQLSNSTFLHFTSAQNESRLLLIHLPWNDGIIYYDVNGALNMQRISYNVTSEVTNMRRHFVFRSRSVTTPRREIFINGVSVVDSGANTTNNSLPWGGVVNMFQNWTGDIYYLKLYNIALTNEEIATAYSRVLDDYMNPAILSYDATDLQVGTVTTWANKGSLGADYNATNVGTVSCQTDTLGKFVNFNGSYMNIGTLGIQWNFNNTGTQGATFAIVAKIQTTTSSPWENFLNFALNATGADGLALYRNGTTANLSYGTRNASNTIEGSMTATNVLTGTFRVFIVVQTSSNATLYVDGTVGSTGSWSIANKASTFGGIACGSDKNYIVNNAQYRQVLIYNFPLAVGEVSALTQQLRTKWGI